MDSADNHSADKGDCKGDAQAAAANQDSAGTLDPVQPNPEPQPVDGGGKTEQPRSYEKVIATWTMVLGFSTIVLAIATGLSAYFLYVTDHTLKETLIETGRAARAAEDSVKLATATSRKQLRAYLTISNVKFDCTNCIKTYGSIYAPYERPVTKPVQGSVRVAVAGDEVTEDTDFTYDKKTGLVTFLPGHKPGMGEAVTAGFRFDVPVRFDTDYLEVDLSAFAAGAIPRIPLVETKP